MLDFYINYNSFELVCWDTDGNDTNVSIELTEEQAKKVCEAIGLIGFAEENGNIVVGYKKQSNRARTGENGNE